MLGKLGLPQRNEHRCVYAVEKRAAGANGDQRVHVRRALEQRFEADPEEPSARKQHGNGQYELNQRERQRMIHGV
ncbi:hypothetical protein SDC9_99593 [bioreactor metagenome]|uniref:Uncharacterized protein n=1 Tax=bioreactor metagenome TaxID=1076179 RepID=A0A645AI16_9ZZZZ